MLNIITYVYQCSIARLSKDKNLICSVLFQRVGQSAYTWLEVVENSNIGKVWIVFSEFYTYAAKSRG